MCVYIVSFSLLMSVVSERFYLKREVNDKFAKGFFWPQSFTSLGILLEIKRSELLHQDLSLNFLHNYCCCFYTSHTLF